MYKVERSYCKHETEELAVKHLEVIKKSSRVVDLGVGFDDKHGHHTWFDLKQWTDNNPVEEEE